MDFCRQIFRVLKMDASVPVDSRVIMQKRALRKYLADSGFTDVVKPGGRLKPDVKVTIGEDRPPRLGGGVVTFEDMREFIVACLEYEQQVHVAN